MANIVLVDTKGGDSGFRVETVTLVDSGVVAEFSGSVAIWSQMLGWCFFLQDWY